MEPIHFGGFSFTVTKAGRVILTRCFGFDTSDRVSEKRLSFCEADVAGGATGGWNRMSGSEETRALRYVSHAIEGNALCITQRSPRLEVVSRFEGFEGTNAVRVTQTLRNVTQEPFCLEMANTLGVAFTVKESEMRDFYFHKFTNARYSESLPDVRSFYDLGMFCPNALFHVENIGNASALENVPQGIIENRATGEHLMFMIESYFDWFYELSNEREMCQLQLGGPSAIRHQWNKLLQPGESYTTVPAVFACAASLNGVLGEMTVYRRHIKSNNPSDADLPAIYNEYMHYSWDDPNEARTRKTAAAVAKTGCDYYVVDCGWHNSTDWNGKIYRAFGTWYEDRGRFPEGIGKTAEYVRSLGMKFGLWIGPEVVGRDNKEMLDYYGDDAFFVRGGKKIGDATRYLLDFRSAKVRDYMTKAIDRMVDEYGCDYIKFDGCPDSGFGTDRDATSPGDGLEKHTEAFLQWVKDAMERHPDVIFEDCFGGGMRTDYKALSMFSLISTSDQTRYDHYPYITANIFASVLPEQAAVWSYPVDSSLYDPEHKEDTDRRVSEERVVINMVNALLGRIHLASRIHLLSEKKQALIREGIDIYKKMTPEKKTALPYLPLGYAAFGDTFVSVGLKTETKIYLAVWNLHGERNVTLPLPDVRINNAKVIYPSSLPTRFTFNDTSLNLHFTEDEQARLFEIDLA